MKDPFAATWSRLIKDLRAMHICIHAAHACYVIVLSVFHTLVLVFGLLRYTALQPEDLLVLKTGAAQRRRLLDTALCQLRPGYERALTEYTRLLEHKSRILKDWREYPGLADTLPDFNRRMAQVGAILIGYRANYLEKLAHQLLNLMEATQKY
mgnify:CR=1 FL=1